MSTAPSAIALESAGDAAEPAVTTWIRAGGWRRGIDPRELWSFRELAWALAVRDLRVRYKQTLLGGAWAMMQPLGAMVVLNLFFGHGLGLADRVEAPYAIFLYAGLLPWTLFVAGVNASANSVLGNAHIVSKVYFPRLILPASATFGPMIDFALAAAVLLAMMAWYRTPVTPALALAPLIVASILMTTLGVGVAVSSLVVRFRDLRHALPFITQMWMFVTPVIYPPSVLPAEWLWLIRLNPMAGPIDAFRAAVLGTPIDYVGWGTSSLVGALLLVAGVASFVRTERQFADVI